MGTENDPNAAIIVTIPPLVQPDFVRERSLSHFAIQRRRFSGSPAVGNPLLPVRPIEFGYSFTDDRAAPDGNMTLDQIVHRRLIVAEGCRPRRDTFHQSEQGPERRIVIDGVAHQWTVATRHPG